MNQIGMQVFECSGKIAEIELLRNKINETISRHCPSYEGSLEMLHAARVPDMNKIRLDCFNELNKIPDLDSILYNIVGERIAQILGPDILRQKKINISIQMPLDESALLKAHSDSWAGDSPFQINLWLPLTDAFDTNSMFIFNRSETISILKKIQSGANLIIDELISRENFLSLSFGQYLLFNPALIHGNVVNRTQRTRVSLNIRFKSLFTPDGTSASRSSGLYYKLFRMSDWSRLAFDLDEVNSNGR